MSKNLPQEVVIQNDAVKNIKEAKADIPDLPRAMKSDERNDYKSADVLVRRLAETVVKWRSSLEENMQPAILAILNGSIQIQVTSLSVEGYNGIRIDGTLNGAKCMMLTHQNSAQLLCYASEITEAAPRRGIGFILGDNEKLSTD